MCVCTTQRERTVSGVRTSTTTPPGGLGGSGQLTSAEVKSRSRGRRRPTGHTSDRLCPLSGCHCHGHAHSCHFDPARFQATGGVSGGVCDNCRHGRTGPQCEHCPAFFYQDPQRAREDPQACIRTPHLPPALLQAIFTILRSFGGQNFGVLLTFQRATATRPVRKAAACAIL